MTWLDRSHSKLEKTKWTYCDLFVRYTAPVNVLPKRSVANYKENKEFIKLRNDKSEIINVCHWNHTAIVVYYTNKYLITVRMNQLLFNVSETWFFKCEMNTCYFWRGKASGRKQIIASVNINRAHEASQWSSVIVVARALIKIYRDGILFTTLHYRAASNVKWSYLCTRESTAAESTIDSGKHNWEISKSRSYAMLH